MAGLRTSQENMSSSRQSFDSNESTAEEKTIYENLMEIFPLMEDFMKNQGTMTRTSFAHQAPMSFTRAPSRQVPQKRKLDLKQIWTNAEETSDRSESIIGSESIKPMSTPLSDSLQRDVEELSNRLRETELQSSVATKELESTLEAKEGQIVEMELMVRRLQKEVQRKEMATYSAHNELADTKDEVARMRSIMQKAESDICRTKDGAADFEEELFSIQLQLSALQSEVSANDRILSQSLQKIFHDVSKNPNCPGQINRVEWHGDTDDKVELARRAYLAAVIVARETGEESPLMLCALLRIQLQALLKQSDLFLDSQE